jgi:hypothetical protein
MSDNEYDEIDVNGDEIDEFDEIDVENADEIDFENIKDRDDEDVDQDDDEDDEDELDVLDEEVIDPEDEEDGSVLAADYFHKVLDKQSQDYISSMSTDARDCIVVNPDQRITSRFMKKKEYARILGVRRKLLSMYPKVFTDVTNIIDPKLKAIKEIKEKRCPLMLKRTIGTTKDNKDVCEIWSVNELIVPFD